MKVKHDRLSLSLPLLLLFFFSVVNDDSSKDGPDFPGGRLAFPQGIHI